MVAGPDSLERNISLRKGVDQGKRTPEFILPVTRKEDFLNLKEKSKAVKGAGKVTKQGNFVKTVKGPAIKSEIVKRSN